MDLKFKMKQKAKQLAAENNKIDLSQKSSSESDYSKDYDFIQLNGGVKLPKSEVKYGEIDLKNLPQGSNKYHI